MDIEKMLRRKPKKIYSPIDENWYDWNGETLDKYPSREESYIFEAKYKDKPLYFKIWSDKRVGYIYIESLPLTEFHCRSLPCCDCCLLQGFGDIRTENNNQIVIRSIFAVDRSVCIHISQRICRYYEQCSFRIWGELHRQRIESDFIIDF